MDLRIHFDRPVSLLELEIENNSLCILSTLGRKLKQLRLPSNGSWLNISVNSKTYAHPIKNSAGLPAKYGAKFDVKSYEKFDLENQKKFLLNWLTDIIEEALNFFLENGVDEKTRDDLKQFRENCPFCTKFTGKWAQHKNHRARVVIYQRFQQADIHIESKIYRARKSTLSPILGEDSPSVFIFQKYLDPPVLKNGEWCLPQLPSRCSA